MADVIVAEDVKKAFGDVQALDGLTLRVESGTVMGLLGPNGAGKTTLVRILTTLLRPDEGKAELDGIDVLREPQQARSRFGLAGQFPAVDETLTGYENLELVGRLYRMKKADARARATELLKQLDLVEAGSRVVKTYSGGMRRRLDIGASLVARPPILILDEPTTGLDPRARIEMWEAIRNLVSGGTTLLLTTQYLEEADALADKIVVIDNGRAIASGTPDELKSRLGNDVLEVKVREEAEMETAMKALEDIGAARLEVATRTITLQVDDGSQSLFAAVKKLDEAGVALTDLGLRRPSLDEVFFALTGDPMHNGVAVS